VTILILDTSLEPTGAFKAAFNNALLLKDRHRFVFILKSGSRLGPLLDAHGFAHHSIPVRHISRDMKNNLRFPFTTFTGVRALLKIIRNEKADVVYQNEVFIITGALARFFRSFRLVSHVRVLTRIFPKPLYKIWYQLNKSRSNAVAAVSDVCKAEVEALCGPQPELQVLYDFIIPEERLPQERRISTATELRILFIGNYTRGKGQELAIEACERLTARFPEHRVVLNLYGSDFGQAGNIAFRAELSDMAATSKAVIRLHDFAPEVEPLMKSHDVLLNLSVAESFSFVVAEGLSYGTPVIATKSGGPVELIEDGVSGLLSDSNADAIAERMERLLRNPALHESMGLAGRARIRNLIAERGGVGRFEDLLIGRR
jgi:glycosyltransferase involved in cell wall biosynthesis